MARFIRTSVVRLVFAGAMCGPLVVAPEPSFGDDTADAPARCGATEDFFADQVWAKVGERICLNCHTDQGEASQSHFELQDPARHRDAGLEPLAANRAAFLAMATADTDDMPRMLAKVVGDLDHGGGRVVEPDSSEYQILEHFVDLSDGIGDVTHPPQSSTEQAGMETAEEDIASFFSGVIMVDDERLLRRVALSLAARLPTTEEQAMLKAQGGHDGQGREALATILDRMMEEEAFYDRLTEGFNDIFLTLGYDGVPERVLSYDHFGDTRHWTQEHNLDHLPEDQRTKARYKLTDDYRDAILREPLELIEYIARNNRPFTELVTADYIMVTPYTSRGYGIHDQLRDQFQDADDPFEYIPTRLRALQHRDGHVQESATGYYPHSGFLSLFHYLRRYPTTETNRNRLRARMFYQHFLGVDVMQLAPRVTDAAAVDAKYANPTMEAPDCVVCHKTIDPVAGLFQDYYNEDGYFGPRRDGWFTDVFPPGFEGEDLPDQERWRALQWLGERTAEDPRFAVAMVEHVYYILMGRRVLLPPQDIDDPAFAARRRAYRVQRQIIEEVAERFVESDYNIKEVFKALVATPFYRADGLAADGLAAASEDPHRRAALEDVGLVRLLTPEQLDRKIHAIFGHGWENLTDQFEILYGGINSSTVTERIADPSGAMGAIQRMMANEVACRNVARDFTTPPAERLLFPHIELDVVPGSGAEAEMRIRRAIVHLHERLLGRQHAVDHPEVDRTYQLFVDIIDHAHSSEGQLREGVEPRESYFCRGRDDQRIDDPHYTLRAWRAVVTYLLRQHDFLYE